MMDKVQLSEAHIFAMYVASVPIAILGGSLVFMWLLATFMFQLSYCEEIKT